MEGGFRLYSEDDVARVEQIKRLQSLLGLTLAEIKDMVEAEEVSEELNATYRPDRPVEERIQRVDRRIEVTQRQYDIITTKLTAMQEMRTDLEEKLQRYREVIAELEAGTLRRQSRRLTSQNHVHTKRPANGRSACSLFPVPCSRHARLRVAFRRAPSPPPRSPSSRRAPAPLRSGRTPSRSVARPCVSERRSVA